MNSSTEIVSSRDLEQEFSALLGNVQKSWQGGMISFIDSDAARVVDFLEDNPGLASEESIAAAEDALGAIVKAGWDGDMEQLEESLDKIRRRLE